MINTLPFEIGSKIYGYLSIDEVTSVDIAYREQDYSKTHAGFGITRWSHELDRSRIIFFEKLFSDRISMNLYLGQYFSDSQELLKCMLINDIILSGSRTLNYFVPGSAHEYSDWDFYADGDQDKIFRFMEFMKSIGIRWFTAVEWFTQKLENDKFESGITVGQIHTLQCIIDTTSQDEIIMDAIQVLYDEIREDDFDKELKVFKVNVRNSKGNDKVFVLRDDAYSKFNIIYGTFISNRRRHNIQLMSDSRGILSILDFYTSALQCGITGFCAFHMYAKDAYNRQSRLWASSAEYSESATMKVKDSQKKYEKRGYVFYKTSLSTLEFPYQANTVFKRHLKDPESHVIDYNIDGPRIDDESKYGTTTLSDFASEKRRKFYEFAWIQNGRDLMASEYHNIEMNYAKEDAVSEFMHKLANDQPNSRKRAEILSTLSELASLTNQFRTLCSPTQTILDSQEKMPDKYLDDFVRTRELN